MVTIYKTFIYTSLVLIAKGFCVISDVLRRRDLSIVALVTGSVYLIYSAYFIDPNLIMPVLLCMILALFYITTKYTLENIKLLRNRQQDLIISDIQNLILPIQAKISLFVYFLRLSYFYFIEQFCLIALAIVVGISKGNDEDFYVSMVYFDEIFEFVAVSGVLFLLRPKENIQYFDIGLIEPNQPYVPLAPVYNAVIPSDLEMQVVPNKPALLIGPKGYNRQEPFKNLLIACPVERK